MNELKEDDVTLNEPQRQLDGSGVEAEEEDDGGVEEWMLKALKEFDWGVEIEEESLQTLIQYLEEIMKRVVEEAHKAGCDGKRKTMELTSLDIREALKKLLPGERLRPYLPSTTKQAWNMDKKSLKGIKRRRQQ